MRSLGIRNRPGVISQEGWLIRIQGRSVYKSWAHHSDEGQLSWCVALLDPRMTYAARLEVTVSVSIKTCDIGVLEDA